MSQEELAKRIHDELKAVMGPLHSSHLLRDLTWEDVLDAVHGATDDEVEGPPTERFYEHMIQVHALDPTGYDTEAERIVAHQNDHARSSAFWAHGVNDFFLKEGPPA